MKALRRLAEWRNALPLLLVAGGLTVIGMAGNTPRTGIGASRDNSAPGRALRSADAVPESRPASGNDDARSPKTAPRGLPDAIEPPANGAILERMAAGS